MQHLRQDSPIIWLVLRGFILSSIILSNGCHRNYVPMAENGTLSNEVIGRIEYNWGQYGFVNGNKVRPGGTVYNGDRVSTGDATSISVYFIGGGFMQLDANTDPDFRKWFEMGRCIIRAFIQFGQVFVETGNTCDLLIDDKHLSALAHTRFNLEVRPSYSILSVIEGEITISRPQPERIRSRQQLIVFEDGRTEVKTLSPREIKEIQHWRKPVDNEIGWCCAVERVFQATTLECRRRHGFFGKDYKEITRACQVRQIPKGYCCVNGEVHWLAESACEKRRGQFFDDERRAQRYCQRLSPVEGWCCRNGRLFQASIYECQKQRGVFNQDYRVAQNSCHSTEPERGFCCSNGKVSRQNRAFCRQSGGKFYTDARMAKLQCITPETGWCCKNGKVFTADRKYCSRIQGKFSNNESKLRCECRSVLRIDPNVIKPPARIIPIDPKIIRQKLIIK